MPKTWDGQPINDNGPKCKCGHPVFMHINEQLNCNFPEGCPCQLCQPKRTWQDVIESTLDIFSFGWHDLTGGGRFGR